MIADEISRFVDSALRNVWLEDENGKVYVRKSRRFLNGEAITTLDIASIEAIVRGKGFFKTVRVAAENSGLSVYVENVLEPRLVDHLLRNGYTMIGDRNFTPCFYKIQ